MAQDLSTGPRRVPAPPTVRVLRMRIAATRVRQRQIAGKLGMSEGHLSEILAGHRHVDDVALRLRIAEAIESLAGEAAA